MEQAAIKGKKDGLISMHHWTKAVISRAGWQFPAAPVSIIAVLNITVD